MSELDEHLELDVPKIKNAIRLQVPVVITSYTLPRNMELYMHQVLDCFLEQCHQPQLKEYLNFCLGEILTNGKKANTKRVYFKTKGLDINNPEDYEKGMLSFKEDTLTNIDYYLELQKKEGLYVQLCLKMDIDNVVVEIKNNSILTAFEQERINDKLDSVQQYHNMEEVFSKVLDTTEGAGLGIIIMVLMLQKVGLSKDNFKIFSTDTETITRIVLPCNNQVFQVLYDLSQRFVAETKQFPVYAETLNEVWNIASADVIDRNAILKCVRNNPSLLMAAVQKSEEKDCFDLSPYAVIEKLSDEDLKAVYNPENAFFNVVEATPALDNIFEHTRRVAMLCYNLAKNAELLKQEITVSADYLYGLGLLSHLGQIMINSMNPEQKKILDEVSSEDARDFFLEGINSGFLSLQYAKNCHFPDSTPYQLAGWNFLRLCPKQTISFMKVLYMAEIMQYYSEGVLQFYQIEKDTLKQFQINDESQLDFVINQIKTVL